jgi:hypothetical protein
MRRLSILLLLIPFWLLAACSDDDDDEPAASATSPAAIQAAASGAEAAIKGSITVDFTGSPDERERVEATFDVAPGTTAWDAVKTALGEENLTFEDFGGTLGIFITGFNGVEVEGNHFWEFKVNGEGSEVGVSSYVVQQGDMIEFVYSSL